METEVCLMPIYEYRCKSCNHRFEIFFCDMNAGDVEICCPSCRSQDSKRIMSSFAATGVSTPSSGGSCSGSCSHSSCSSCGK
ncbi:MAG: zinc ribbon domain-containing protein [bacterium]